MADAEGEHMTGGGGGVTNPLQKIPTSPLPCQDSPKNLQEAGGGDALVNDILNIPLPCGNNSGSYRLPSGGEMHDDVEPSVLHPCTVCGRTFKAESLPKHTRICERALVKKRRTFDSSRQRLSGTDLLPPPPTNTTHKAVQEAAKTTQTRGASGDAHCPHCERSFGPKALDRHVEWCGERKARLPKSPASNPAKARLEARTQYRAPPLPRSKRSVTQEKYAHLESSTTTSRAPTVSWTTSSSRGSLPPSAGMPRTLESVRSIARVTSKDSATFTDGHIKSATSPSQKPLGSRGVVPPQKNTSTISNKGSSRGTVKASSTKTINHEAPSNDSSSANKFTSSNPVRPSPSSRSTPLRAPRSRPATSPENSHRTQPRPILPCKPSLRASTKIALELTRVNLCYNKDGVEEGPLVTWKDLDRCRTSTSEQEVNSTFLRSTGSSLKLNCNPSASIPKLKTVYKLQQKPEKSILQGSWPINSSLPTAAVGNKCKAESKFVRGSSFEEWEASDLDSELRLDMKGLVSDSSGDDATVESLSDSLASATNYVGQVSESIACGNILPHYSDLKSEIVLPGCCTSDENNDVHSKSFKDQAENLEYPELHTSFSSCFNWEVTMPPTSELYSVPGRLNLDENGMDTLQYDENHSLSPDEKETSDLDHNEVHSLAHDWDQERTGTLGHATGASDSPQLRPEDLERSNLQKIAPDVSSCDIKISESFGDCPRQIIATESCNQNEEKRQESWELADSKVPAMDLSCHGGKSLHSLEPDEKNVSAINWVSDNASKPAVEASLPTIDSLRYDKEELEIHGSACSSCTSNGNTSENLTAMSSHSAGVSGGISESKDPSPEMIDLSRVQLETSVSSIDCERPGKSTLLENCTAVEEYTLYEDKIVCESALSSPSSISVGVEASSEELFLWSKTSNEDTMNTSQPSIPVNRGEDIVHAKLFYEGTHYHIVTTKNKVNELLQNGRALSTDEIVKPTSLLAQSISPVLQQPGTFMIEQMQKHCDGSDESIVFRGKNSKQWERKREVSAKVYLQKKRELLKSDSFPCGNIKAKRKRYVGKSLQHGWSPLPGSWQFTHQGKESHQVACYTSAQLVEPSLLPHYCVNGFQTGEISQELHISKTMNVIGHKKHCTDVDCQCSFALELHDNKTNTVFGDTEAQNAERTGHKQDEFYILCGNYRQQNKDIRADCQEVCANAADKKTSHVFPEIENPCEQFLKQPQTDSDFLSVLSSVKALSESEKLDKERNSYSLKTSEHPIPDVNDECSNMKCDSSKNIQEKESVWVSAPGNCEVIKSESDQKNTHVNSFVSNNKSTPGNSQPSLGLNKSDVSLSVRCSVQNELTESRPALTSLNAEPRSEQEEACKVDAILKTSETKTTKLKAVADQCINLSPEQEDADHNCKQEDADHNCKQENADHNCKQEDVDPSSEQEDVNPCCEQEDLSFSCVQEDISHNHDLEDVDHNHGLEGTDNNHDLEDVDHNHGLEDVDHNHGLEDVDHNHGLKQVDHNHDLEDVGHNHDLKDVDHNHDLEDVDHNHDLENVDHNHDLENVNLNFEQKEIYPKCEQEDVNSNHEQKDASTLSEVPDTANICISGINTFPFSTQAVCHQVLLPDVPYKPRRGPQLPLPRNPRVGVKLPPISGLSPSLHSYRPATDVESQQGWEEGGLRQSSSKLSADSAYSSLNRKTPPLVEPVRCISPSGSHNLFEATQPPKLSKFCHECGAKYPIPVAKFCCECGVRRLVI